MSLNPVPPGLGSTHGSRPRPAFSRFGISPADTQLYAYKTAIGVPICYRAV